jgi:ABC-type antimicrobial peptide transport system permease subunit
VLQPGLLSTAQDEDAMLMRWLLLVVGIVAGISVLLSVASLYALMAFTVERRTREIGLRSALGAPPGKIVTVIARRAVMQLLVGISLATVAITYLIHEVIPGPDGPIEGWPWMIVVSAGVVFLIGLASCSVPTVRGLRIRPVQALKV